MPFARTATVLAVSLCSALNCLAQTEMARLRPQVTWQRTSPSSKVLDGPVLYQIIMRSNATQGHIPKISNTFTLTNSLISEDVNGIHIGNMSVDSTGIITFAGGQIIPFAALPVGTTANTVAPGNDARLSDARPAASVNFAAATLSGMVPLSNLPASTSPAASTIPVADGSGKIASGWLPGSSLGVLAADYEFDETSGTTFADSSGFNNT